MVSSIGYSLGIGSGLDIKNLIDGLSAAEKAPKEAILKRREEANSAKISALADAAAGIDSFATALSALVSGGSLFSQPNVSEPTLLSVSAIPGTRLGNLSADLEVVQLAKSQTLQSGLLASSSAAVGQGDLTLTTAAGSFTVTIDGSNDSLSGLADAINAKNAGVSASVITDQGGARLILKGATGEANAFTLDVPTGTSSGLERFAYGPSVTGGMSLAQTAQDAMVRLDGVEVKRASNSFKDLVPGVQIDLKKASPGTRIALGLTRPGATIEQAIGDFVSAYNELSKALAGLTAAGLGGQATGPLRGDLAMREMQRQLAQLPSMVLNSQGSIKTLTEIGVATNRDGTLTLNKGRLQSMLASNPNDVEALFNPVQYTDNPLVAVTSPIGKVKPGTYTLTNLVPASGTSAASGEIDGVAGNGMESFLIAPFSSDAVGLVVEIKGAVASATVTIDPGLGGALQAIRDSIRARSGPISKSQERLSAETKAIAADRAALEARAKARYDQLVTSFTAMERQVSAFKATQAYLENQIKAWNSDND